MLRNELLAMPLSRLASPFEDLAIPLREFTTLIPLSDIREDDAGYQLEVDLPGVHAQDIFVDCSDFDVMISAKRAKSRTQQHYERRFRFPERIEAEQVNAVLENGILTLSVPKAVKRKAVRVELKQKSRKRSGTSILDRLLHWRNSNSSRGRESSGSAA